MYLDRDQVWHLQTWQWTLNVRNLRVFQRCCCGWSVGKNDIGAGTDTDFIGTCTPGLSVLTLWILRCQASSKRREPLTSENTWILKLEIRTGWNFWIGERRQLLKEIDVAWSYSPLSDGSEECPVADFREHGAEFLVSVKGGLFIV
jgi:hypothetical protein